MNPYPLGRSDRGFCDGINHDLARHIFHDEALFSGLLHDLYPCILLEITVIKMQQKQGRMSFTQGMPRYFRAIHVVHFIIIRKAWSVLQNHRS